MCITSLWGGFPNSIARQPRGCQYRTNTERYVFGKLSATCFQRRPFWHRQYSSCGDIELGKLAQGGVIYTAVVYGKLYKAISSAATRAQEGRIEISCEAGRSP